MHQVEGGWRERSSLGQDGVGCCTSRREEGPREREDAGADAQKEEGSRNGPHTGLCWGEGACPLPMAPAPVSHGDPRSCASRSGEPGEPWCLHCPAKSSQFPL